jgi:hypothetical protein
MAAQDEIIWHGFLHAITCMLYVREHKNIISNLSLKGLTTKITITRNTNKEYLLRNINHGILIWLL